MLANIKMERRKTKKKVGNHRKCVTIFPRTTLSGALEEPGNEEKEAEELKRNILNTRKF